MREREWGREDSAQNRDLACGHFNQSASSLPHTLFIPIIVERFSSGFLKPPEKLIFQRTSDYHNSSNIRLCSAFFEKQLELLLFHAASRDSCFSRETNSRGIFYPWIRNKILQLAQWEEGLAGLLAFSRTLLFETF